MSRSTAAPILAGFGLLLTIVASIAVWPQLVSRLLVSAPYAPHGICLLWEPDLIALRALTNGLIGVAYMAISITLLVLVSSLRNQLPFHWTFLAFGGFIFFCGLTHFSDVLTLWYPYYWFDGSLRVLTAFVSVLTAIVVPFHIRPVHRLIRNAHQAEQNQRERNQLYAQQELAVQQLQEAVESRERDLLKLLEKLRESEALFRLALSGSSTSVFFADDALRYRWVYNPPAPLKAETLIGRTDAELFEPILAAQLTDMKRRALQENTEQQIDVIAADDAGERVFDVRALPAHSNGDRQIGVVGIVSDVTTRKVLEERVSHLQRMESVGRLAGGIAHDFNNLLMVILGNLELVRSDLPEDHPNQTDLSAIGNAAEQAAKLTRQMLTLARRQPIAPQIINLNQIIESIEQVLSRVIHPMKLHLDLAETVPIYADPHQIEQVLMNLLQNAREACTDSASVTIRTGMHMISSGNPQQLPAGEYVELQIIDTGKGIEPQVIGRVFEPFFSTKGPRGSGMGLAICYSIISQHSGSITISSHPGEGTTVRILLPITSLTSDETPVDSSHPTGNGELVLLVEDQAAVRDLVLRVVRDLGYRVVTATDGQEALNLIRSSNLQPQIVLTDVLMPNMNGLELATQLRRERPELPVLFMTGYSEGHLSERIDMLLGTPHTALIHKPFAVALLAQKLHTMMNLLDHDKAPL